MPLFVGVVDQETPACERVASADDAKHRAFDAFVNPNAQRVGANATATGAAGWGVQGHLGSEASVVTRYRLPSSCSSAAAAAEALLPHRRSVPTRCWTQAVNLCRGSRR